MRVQWIEHIGMLRLGRACLYSIGNAGFNGGYNLLTGIVERHSGSLHKARGAWRTGVLGNVVLKRLIAVKHVVEAVRNGQLCVQGKFVGAGAYKANKGVRAHGAAGHGFKLFRYLGRHRVKFSGTTYLLTRKQ